MKKIVPFTKDLMFKTKIGEITSIALDNTLKLDRENVSGEFIVSGTYKMLEASSLEEEFKYNIPVDITIDSKYETKNCVISIDDFSYEIINEEKLKVNISVMLDDLDIKEDPIEKVEVVLPDDERNSLEYDLLDNEIESDLENLFLESKESIKLETSLKKEESNLNVNIEKENTLENNLFENISDAHEYSIYRVILLKKMIHLI